MVPAERESSEEWTDRSGRYWIGLGSRAKLCFCRILRSRTVMVRVGGGWVELSRYLMDRYADAMEAPSSEEPSAEADNEGTVECQTESVTVSSATLAKSLSASRSSLPATPITPARTPARRSLPAFSSSPVEPSSRRTSDRYSQSPSFGPSSPQVVQLIRKASESPSIRDREREVLRSRPSFPREGSTGL